MSVESKEYIEEFDVNSKRYNKLIELSPDAMYVIENNKIVFANNKGCELLGITNQKECLEKNITDYIHSDYKDIFKNTVELAVSEKKIVQPVEYKLLRHDKKLIYIEATLAVIESEQHYVLLIVARDVSKKKNLEQRLEESQKFNQLVLDSLIANIAIISSTGEIAFTNKSWEQFALDNGIKDLSSVSHGINYLDVCKKAAEESDYYALEALNGITEVIKGEKNHFILEYPCNSPNEIRWFLMYVSPVTTNREFTIVNHINITQRVKAEERAKKLSQALEQSPIMVMISDVDGVIEYVNEKFIKATGFGTDGLIGNHIQSPHFKEKLENMFDKLKDVMENGEEWRGEIKGYTKRGDSQWTLLSISPIRDVKGDVTHYISIQKDITKRKLAEEKLIESNEALQKLIVELQETQSKLIQQEKLAGIGQLAAGVAHEINNPLGFVISNFQTLRKYVDKLKESINVYRSSVECMGTCSKPEAIKKIEKIQSTERKNNIEFIINDLEDIFSDSMDGLKRVGDIVKGLRLFSRVDYLGEFEEYDINEGIKSTLIVARNEIKYYAKVEENLENVPLIDAIGIDINQVLLNMIINAVYAIKTKDEEHDGVIKIKTYNDDSYVFCEIEDNGIGISKEDINKIFTPFFTTKPVGKGTGLGLSIAYDAVVNKHKGDISVYTEVGVGTRFVIKLPIRQNIE